MKKNLKKLFALLLVVVMVAAMFAGCANNAEKPAETLPATPTPPLKTPTLPPKTTPRLKMRLPSRPVRTRSSTAAPPKFPVTSATHGGPTMPPTR